jgi:hypothetical protein
MIETEIKALNRKLKLKRQALQLIRAEMEEIRCQLTILKLRKHVDGRIARNSESVDTARLDPIITSPRI